MAHASLRVQLLTLAAIVAFLAAVVQGNVGGKTKFFGKFRWGQDKVHVFLTMYVPGADTSDIASLLRVDNETFHFEAVDPETNKPATVAFDFREPVDAASMTFRPGTWKYGNANNTVFITVKKQHEHLFDRLTYQKPTKAFKRIMEKDWDRYVVNEDEGADDEDDEDEDDGPLKKLTDENFDSSVKKASVLVFSAKYPWCDKCKDNKLLEDAAKDKRNTKDIVYGHVDAREQRKIRRKVKADCSASICSDYLYLASTKWEEPFKYNHTDTSYQGILKYAAKIGGAVPRPIKTKDAVKKLGLMDELTVLGIFHTEKDAAAMASFQKVAEAQRMDHFFGMATEKTVPEGDLVAFIQEAATANKIRPKASETTARIILLKTKWKDASKKHGAGGTRDSVSMLGHRTGDQLTEESIGAFIKQYREDLVAYMNRYATDHAKNLAKSHGHKYAAHLWVKDQRSEDKDFKGALAAVRQAAQQYHRDITFVIHDEHKDTGWEIVGGNVSDYVKEQLVPFGLDGSKRPLFGIEAYEADYSPTVGSADKVAVKSYSYRKALTEKTTRGDISDFCQQVLAGEIPAALKTESPVAARPGRPGRLVGSQVDELMKGSAPAIVSFHSTRYPDMAWHKHLEALAAALKAAGSSMSVLHMNTAQNAIPLEHQATLTSHASSGAIVFVSPERTVSVLSPANVSATALYQAVPHEFSEADAVLAQLQRDDEVNGDCEVTLWEHSHTAGSSARFKRGTFNSSEILRLTGMKNDDVSSVQVSGACTATLYEHSDLSGWRTGPLPAGVHNHDQFSVGATTGAPANDQASALRVDRVAKEDKDKTDAEASTCVVKFTGNSSRVPGGYWGAQLVTGRWDHEQYARRGGINDEEAKVTLLRGCALVCHEHSDFSGWSRRFEFQEVEGAPHQAAEHPLPEGCSAFEVQGAIEPPPPPPEEEKKTEETPEAEDAAASGEKSTEEEQSTEEAKSTEGTKEL